MKVLGKVLITILSICVSIISVVVIIALIIFFAAVLSIYFSDTPAFRSVTKEVFEGCYVEDIDSDCQSIYYYPNGAEKENRKYIVDEWEEVIKYASDNKENIAFHCIYSDDKDVFVVYNTSAHEAKEFKTQEDFLVYCSETGLLLSEWESGKCMDFEIIDIGNGWRIYDAPHPYNDKILNGYGVEYEGYVKDVTIKKDHVAEFVFAVPHGIEKEVPTSNENLDVSENVIGKYKFTMIGKTEVCYYEKLSLNTKTGEVSVFDND